MKTEYTIEHESKRDILGDWIWGWILKDGCLILGRSSSLKAIQAEKLLWETRDLLEADVSIIKSALHLKYDPFLGQKEVSQIIREN